MAKARQLVLLALNELNFDVAKKYVDCLSLPNFARLLEGGMLRTSSEAQYELLEPWIQWVSAQSGLTAAEHGIFRLGDIVGSNVPQFFEALEAKGKRVGAVSPMNAENRLSNPAYFVPDPWTQTPSDGSLWSRFLSAAVAQVVNDNSEGRITVRNAAVLAAGIMRFARTRNYGYYASLALRSRRAPWRKALFLDLFLNDWHNHLLAAHEPDFSMLFLNAGAHIQHHYLLNSRAATRDGPRNPSWYVSPDVDPMAEMLQVYDRILGEYNERRDINLIVATGLVQRPYPQVTFYYRLRNHRAFLLAMGIQPRALFPRMTRDFLVEFDDEVKAATAAQMLGALTLSTDGIALFEKIDNRGRDLFVTLTYPNEIGDEAVVLGGPTPLPFKDQVVFVAIKNGMHDADGYLYCQGEVARFAPEEGEHVKALYSTVLRFFDEQ